MKDAYFELESLYKEIGILKSIRALSQWDNDVNMPKGGSSLKSEQMKFLSGLIHDKITNPEIAELLAKSSVENEWQKRNLNLIEKEHLLSKAYDKNFVKKFTEVCLFCELNWRKAKEENDYQLFADHFSKVLKFVQEKSVISSELLKLNPYDALLEEYDPGRKSKEIDDIFIDLESFLPDLIKNLREKSSQEDFIISLNAAQQAQVGAEIIEKLGFDFNHGRLDTSSHPFSVGFSPDDVRITTRYNNDNIFSSLFAILHEAGHGIYEQNLPREYVFQPVGGACGMTIHESQSLFVERHIGLNQGFIEFILPLYKKLTNFDYTVKQVYNHLHKIDDSLIRVDADEVSYPAHIILRYKLEKALLSGDLLVNDLPDAWNELSFKLLGKKPKSLKDGVLQDIHWAWGAIGYFPTYTLGAIFAAQIDNFIRQNLQMDSLLAKGDFKQIFTFLKEKIHNLGAKFDSNQLIFNATNGPLQVEVFKSYLIKKYS